jgi:hypothetical protein
MIINYLIDNDYVIYSLCTVSVCLIAGYFIKSRFLNSTVTETPNSPPTFYISLDQLKEIEIQSEQENQPKLTDGQLDEIEDTLDNDGQLNDIFKKIFTKEEYEQYQRELLDPEIDFSDNLQAIFDNYDIFF